MTIIEQMNNHAKFFSILDCVSVFSEFAEDHAESQALEYDNLIVYCIIALQLLIQACFDSL